MSTERVLKIAGVFWFTLVFVILILVVHPILAQNVGPIKFHSFELDDDDDSGYYDKSNGDGDGVIEQGENVGITVNLTNQGTSTAFDVVATLRTDHLAITVFDSTKQYGNIGDGETKGPEPSYKKGFHFAVANTALSDMVIFTLEITTSNAGSFADTIRIPIKGGGTVGPIVTSDLLIDDDGERSRYDKIEGDNDGQVEQGETVQLKVELQNSGTAPVLDVNAVLWTDHPDITVIDSTEDYGAIGDGEAKGLERWKEKVFHFGVSNTASSDTVVFTLEISTSNAGSFADTIRIPIKGGGTVGPILVKQEEVEIDDNRDYNSNGDGDGQAEPGETIRLLVPLINNGTAPALGVEALLRTENTSVTVIDSVRDYGAIGDGEEDSGQRKNLRFVVSDTASGGDVVFSLVITTKDGDTFVDSITVAIKGGTAGPLLIHSFEIDDDDASSYYDKSNGDGDGIIEAGETIRLPVVLVNNGTAPALDVEATLRTTHADITIIDSTESYESIGDGKTKSAAGFGSGFEFQVANGAASGEVNFEVEISTGNAGTFTETLQVSIVGGGTVGPVAISSFTIDDDTNDFGDDESNGDGDKIIEPGETIRLPIVLVNNGTAPALDVEATLRTNHADITIIDSTESYESIGDGKTKSAAGFGSGFEFQVATGADTGNVIFDLEITTSNGGSFTDTLSIFVASGGIVGPVEIASFTIDDDSDDFGDDDSNGDDDGVIEQGETIRLPIVLVNNGTASALNVTATLSTTHPDIILKDSTESYESIGEGKTKSAVGFGSGFEFEVANETESSTAFFNLEIQTSNGGAFSDTLSVAIKGGGIVGPVAVATFSIDDDTDNFGDDKSDGDGDGVIEQGETIRLPVLLINNGTAPALNVKATLQSNDPNIIFIDSTESYESIGDGQTKKPEAFANSGGYEFKIADAAANGEINFGLRITTKDNTVYTDQITLMIGQPSDLSPPDININSPLAKIPAPIYNFSISIDYSDGVNGSGLELSSLQIINNRDIKRLNGGAPIKAGENLAMYFNVFETSATFIVPDSLQFPIGNNSLRATIRDRVGNTSEPATVDFYVDIFGVTSVVSGDFVNSSPVAVSGFAITPFVQRVEINGSDAPIKNNSFSRNVALNQGQNEIYVSAFNSQNNSIRADTILVFLDSNAPVLNITSPVFNQIFHYSPIAVRGTVSDENQVGVYVNEQPVDLENGVFEVEVEIDEGENTVLVKAVDNAGNVLSVPLKVFGKAPDSPAGRLRLFLKEQPVLSQLPLPPYSPGTTGGDWDVPTTRWAYRLNGDISGDTYKFSLLVGCLGLGSAEMVATLALRHNGEDFVLATSDTIIGQIAGFIPSGPFLYYFSPQRRTQTITGIDAAAVTGDSLIFTVMQVGGDRIGEVWQGEAGGGFSYIEIPDIAVSVSHREANIPDKFELAQNYPNPFNPETTIKYQLPKSTEVTLKIYNIVGQLVRTLIDQKQPTGYYSVNWNGKDNRGQNVASGVYFYRLRAKDPSASSGQGFVQTRKMALVR